MPGKEHTSKEERADEAMTAGAGESLAQGCICLRQLRTLGLLERAFDFLKRRAPSERKPGGARFK